MLRRIVEFSVRHSGVVISIALLTAAYGIYVLSQAELDVFPEFAPPRVTVQTPAPGLSPRQVEQLVTRPIEDAINGTSDLESLRSKSIQSLSVITAVFKGGTDILKARQLVGERMAQAASLLPQGAGPPAMTPLTSATGTILEVGLTSEKRSLMELRTLADWTVRPRLLAVPGVAKVVVYGGEVRQIQVQGYPDRLRDYGLTIQDLVEAASRSTGVRGSGFIETRNQRITVVSEGQSTRAKQLGEAVFAQHSGMSVRLEDVARVVDAPQPRVGAAAIQGRPAVVIIVSSQYGANTLAVSREAGKALQELVPTFKAQEVTFHPSLFRASAFIDTALRNITRSLLIGGILVVLVLFLFLWNIRTASISAAAIPLSMLIAVIALGRFGLTINTLTLGGLAIAIGEVVDDAVIDVENIFRRLRGSRARGPRRTAIVVDASVEVRSAVVYATFVVALVFLPVLGLSGVQGRLFGPLALAYIFAVFASLLVAMTLTPALSRVLLARRRHPPPEPAAVRAIKGQYRNVLEMVLRRPGPALGGAFLLFAGAFAVAPFLRSSFLPEFQENDLIVHMTAVPGTSLQVSLEVGKQVTEKLLENRHITTVTQKAGRAENSDETRGTNGSEFDLVLESAGSTPAAIKSQVRAVISEFPGLDFEVNSVLSERIEEIISGAAGQVVIEVFGDDLAEIYQKAREIAEVLSGIRGATDVLVEAPPGTPELVVSLRPDRLRQFGFQPVEVLDAVETAYQGRVVAQVFEGISVFDVAVILDPVLRKSPDNLGALVVRSRAGTTVPLRELADFDVIAGRSTIDHIGTRRVQVVSCDVSGRALSTFVAEAKDKVGKISFPEGTYPVFSGEAVAGAQAQRQLLLYSGIAAIGIVLLLALAFGDVRLLLLVLANLPFALAGGALAVFFTGRVLTLGSMVGFVSLFGITARNSMMLVSHYRHIVTVEGESWSTEAALRGALERFTPIVMTALVTGLGLLPLAIGAGQAGREIEGPMAIVILGGLATSTLLNLLVLPALALRYGRFGSRSENS